VSYQLANLKWISPQKFIVSGNDERGIRQMTIINSVSQPFPNVWSYPFELPGDSVLARTELYLGDVRAGTCKKIETEKWEGQQLFVVNADGVNDRLYFMRV
jgi:dipeptidyl-peptidase-4